MKNLLTLKKYFVRYKSKIVAGFIFILLSNAGTVLLPWLLKDALNSLKDPSSKEKLLHYALLIIVTSFVAGVFRYFIRQTIIVVSRLIEFDLRQDFWNHIQSLPTRYFQNTSTGSIMALATNDISAVRMFIGPAVMYAVDTGIRFIFTIVFMISISWDLTLYSLLPLPFLSILIYLVMKKIHHRYTLIQEKFADLTQQAQESFSGIRVIKSYVAEEREIEAFTKVSTDYLTRNMSLIKLQAFFQPILFLITGVSAIVTIWIGGYKVINGSLAIGDITAMVLYLSILIWPTIAIGWVLNIIQQAEASMKRINDVLNRGFEIEDNSETDFAITELNGEIEFKNVSFSYGKDLPVVLSGLNLKIKQGETVAIMGHTGSGKSSLINLIPRMYDVTAGDILIDGKSIKSYPLSVLRKNIGIVQQETFLFSDTIRENLFYGLPVRDEELLLKISKAAGFDKDVNQFPQGYDTIVGERGITLSGGQKQRATLARALMINPKILILDDSFSAVDTHTEEEILTNMNTFLTNRTTFIISHRVSTIKNANKIIILKDGKIVEEGTHEQLVALNGIYAETYKRQLLEQELEEI